jgi:putative hydrolase of the HAD superfamily
MVVAMGRQTVVMDGDDTLWFVEPLYDEARQSAAAIVAAGGLDGVCWERIQRRVDVELVRTLGTSAKRFPTSCVEAYRKLSHESGQPVSPLVEDRIRRAAQTVFRRKARTVDGLADILEKLRERFTVTLLTKGDEGVQRRRIADAGVGDAFDHVSIVQQKGEAEFRAMLDAVYSTPRLAWSVGNSLASDINPALRIGMRAIWVDAPVWEYERRELEPEEGHLIVASSLTAAGEELLRLAVSDTVNTKDC